MPKLFIISGCNGAGKTTASYTILPEMLNCIEFVNADEIAKGISPFSPESAAIQAGRIMLERVADLLANGKDFAIETTLATRTHLNIVREAQAKGYVVTLLFFWLNVPELAIERVRLRVKSGGHNVNEKTILRRYNLGIRHLFDLYLPACEYWMLIDNSNSPEVIVEGGLGITTKVHNKTLFNQLFNCYERIRNT